MQRYGRGTGLGERRCSCGTRLARDNRGDLCAACRKKVSGHVARRPLVPRSFWQSAELHEALDAWHIGQAIRAYRLHEFHPAPIAQATAANWLGVTQAQLSRIENGPPVTDLAKLIPWALALGIPEELLWFKLPKQKPDPATRPTTGGATVSPVPAKKDMEDDMRRRTVLQGLVAGTGTVLSSAMFGSLAQIEQIRRELERLLDGSDIGSSTADHWEEVPGEYGQRFLVLAPDRLLLDIAGDFVELRHVLDRQHTTKDRAMLARASGQLAVLAGQCLRNLGEMRGAQAWFRTSELAAREAQDRKLAGQAIMWSAITDLWQGAPERALTQLAKAHDLLGQAATPWRAQTLVAQARTLATLGRDQEALRCLGDAEGAFQDMPASALTDPGLGYTERQYHWTVSNAYTRLGMTDEADAVQQSALRLYEPTEYGDRALIQLDQARCLISQGDLASACQHAVRTITAVPAEHQGLVRRSGREFLDQLPPANRNHAAVHELREVLREGSS